MKKSAVALGIIAVLGGTWVGATWYSGKTTEQQFQAQINKINENLDQFFNAPNVTSDGTIKIDHVQIQRGIFSSNISYDLVITSTHDNDSTIIPFNGKLYHGPLPLNQLQHFNVKPVMFSAETEITKNENTKDWFGKNDKTPLRSDFSVGYDRQVTGKLDSDVDAQIDGGDVKWKFTSDYRVDKNGFGQFESTLPYFKLAPPSDENMETEGELKSLVMEFKDGKSLLKWNLASTEFDKVIIGKYETKFGNVHVNGKKGNNDFTLDIKDVSSILNGDVKDNFVDYGLTYKFGGIHLTSGGQNYKLINDAAFNLQFNHLAIKPLNTLFTELAKTTQKTNEQPGTSPEAIAATKELLSENQPQVKIDPISLSNQGGKLAADLDIQLAIGDFESKIQSGKVLDAFSQFAVNLHLDKAAIMDLLSQYHQLESKLSEEEAEKSAKEALDGLLLMVKMNPLLVENDKSVTLNAKLENNKINLNGNMLSWEEFVVLAMASSLTPPEMQEEDEEPEEMEDAEAPEAMEEPEMPEVK
ncbi:YdgA family protein [Aggregatibacter kilianii]|uniref:YdgA family protein n=1 Tax=Aggregatibacter kilianii TaxID=2025884 RepID=UPI000D645819|nr:YdgA family protein [Aggregatibacter kilianii]